MKSLVVSTAPLLPIGTCRKPAVAACQSRAGLASVQHNIISAATFTSRADSDAAPACSGPHLLSTRQRCGARSGRSIRCQAVDPAAADALHAAVSTLADTAAPALVHQLSDLAQHLSLAYERVTLPCSSMNCGDVIYRR